MPSHDSNDSSEPIGEGTGHLLGSAYIRYAAELRAYAHRRINARYHSRCSPESVVHSVFASLLRRRSAFPALEPGAIRNFLLRSVRWKAFNRLRALRAERRGEGRVLSLDASSSLEKIGEPVDRREPSPAAALEAAELWERLLESLSAREREIVKSGRQGSRPIEIAATLGVSLRTVQRAFAKARLLWEELGGAEERLVLADPPAVRSAP